jgi:hypothetical protein
VDSLPHWLLDLLDSCPVAGSGVNKWLFTTGRQLHAHMDERSMFALLKEKSKGCGRPVSDREIEHQIKASRRSAWCPRRLDLFPYANGLENEILSVPSTPAWPEPDLDLIRKTVSLRFGLSELCRQSPLKFSADDPSHTEKVIDAIWPGNPLLCCGLNAYTFATRRRELWRGNLSRYSFIVPNPMLRITGVTKDNKLSEHSLDATAARVYLVVEFDFSEFAPDGVTETIWVPLIREWTTAGITIAHACAALHLHLSIARDLVVVTHSGGKSLHGWYSSFDFSEDENHRFFEYAVRLGADPHTWLRSQFVRMPDGTRENGKRQTIYYLDPGKAVGK